MEKQVIIFEVLKFLAVVLFLCCFYIAAKKAKIIVNGMYEILSENKIELEEKYRKKLSARVVKKVISFKPFEKENLRKFLKSEVFETNEFKLNIKQKVIV